MDDVKFFDARKLHKAFQIKTTYENWISQEFLCKLNEGEHYKYVDDALKVSSECALLLSASAKKSIQLKYIITFLGLEEGSTVISGMEIDPNVSNFFNEIPSNKRISITILYDEFVEKNPTYSDLDRRTFGNYLTKYCFRNKIVLFRGASSKMGGRYFVINR